MRRPLLAVVCSLITGSAFSQGDADLLQCRALSDSLARLTCYDQIAIDTGKRAKLVSPSLSAAPVKFVSGRFKQQAKDYDLNIYSPRIELHLSFSNSAKKTIVAIGHSMTIKDAFGDQIISQMGKLDINIRPGASADSPSFYYWEDNQFMANDPYSKLIGPVDAGTAKAEIVVDRVVYDDGTVDVF